MNDSSKILQIPDLLAPSTWKVTKGWSGNENEKIRDVVKDESSDGAAVGADEAEEVLEGEAVLQPDQLHHRHRRRQLHVQRLRLRVHQHHLIHRLLQAQRSIRDPLDQATRLANA